MKTISTFMLAIGGLSLSMLLAKPASAQSSDKPDISREKHQVHIKIDDDKDGKITRIDTTFEVGPDFDMDAWMKTQGIEMSSKPDGREDVLILKQKCDRPEKTIRIPMSGDHAIVMKECSKEVLPPCDPMDKECMMKWLESDSVMHMLQEIDPSGLPGEQDIRIYHSDGKGGETKMVFNRIIVKKVMIKTDGKEAKKLEAEIYPNPGTGVFSINISIPGKAPAALEITDKSGRILYAEEVQSSGKREVDLTSQGKGTYFLNLKQGKHTLQRKIMVN